ncbi:MAG TPA: cell division protein FtsZ [Aquifex aeolicus]|uniref:Cell division protein FtsZ n=1 Tax=Aquifex aeolicus TaxID=63363 RepID=A0A9D1CG07_AQUAO|nr:cell division protein FtsZ [Aquificales bacterium]HIP98692.1 cell division protein FtsZ [Aquifex aeolicus]HIQ25880.1 cell division protein FtsZ [Aquifex aeolicus]
MDSINPTIIKVIGVGGAGCNAVNRMVQDGIEGVEVFAVNTDVQHLSLLSVPNKIQIGEKITRGLGAGSKPEIGEQAAVEDIEKIKEIVHDADMVFIAAGLGGGTGTGAAPVIAQVAKDLGKLTVAVVTMPFRFEGKQRMEIARKGLERIRETTDAYIVVHNQRLLEMDITNLKLSEAFKMVDQVLSKAVRGITKVVVEPALINIDFADVQTVLKNGGLSLIGLGSASGDNRIEEAIDQAIRSPLLEGESISGASKLIVTFWADENITLADLDYAMQRIENELAADNLVVFGATLVPETDKFEVTIIATGFQQETGGYKASSQPTKKPEKPPAEQPPTPPQPQPSSPTYPSDSNISRILTKLRQKGFNR